MLRHLYTMLLLAGLMAPAAAQQSPSAPLPVLATAGAISLDMSAEEAIAVLRAGRLSIEQEVDLPPDGVNRVILAVPEDDDCIPRGGRFVCPSVRVVLLNDPQRGHRVVRVEAFEAVQPGHSVAEMFRFVASALGPPLQTELGAEQVRGGAVVMWSQRWRDGLDEGPVTEVFVTQDAPAGQVLGLPNPNEPATGVGTVRADEQAEGALTAVRRRLRIR